MAQFIMATQQQAFDWLQKAMDIFEVPSLEVIWGSPECGNLLGCYKPMLNKIFLNPDGQKIQMYVVAHEFAHALEKAYSGSAEECSSYQQCEGFARYFETLYLATDGKLLDFVCDCGTTHLKLLPDGSLQCIDCGTVYYAPLFNPSGFNGTYGQPPATLYYPESRGQLVPAQLGVIDLEAVGHVALGMLYVLTPAATKPGQGKYVKYGLVAGEAISAFKEAVVDPLLFAQVPAKGVTDFLWYQLGFGLGLTLLKAAHRPVWG